MNQAALWVICVVALALLVMALWDWSRQWRR
jgi:hypothetical protein